jgi:protein-S-isoprenylcysteine O-methyltransferase Ste14
MASEIPALLKWILFLAGSAGLVYVSRASLPRVTAHGFYRFFAWEAILALILLNLEHWIEDPFSLRQILSWLCLIASIFLVVHGFSLLRQMGQPDDSRPDQELLAAEKTTRLVTQGAYRWIRHPLYSSLLFLVWGAFLKWITWPGLALVATATIFLLLTARSEEVENRKFFGPAYADYQKKTRMFIPYLF